MDKQQYVSLVSQAVKSIYASHTSPDARAAVLARLQSIQESASDLRYNADYSHSSLFWAVERGLQLVAHRRHPHLAFLKVRMLLG